MNVRARLTLWYAGIMFVSLLAMAFLTYEQFAPEPTAPRAKRQADAEDFREGLRNLLWGGVPAALLALVGGWWLVRRALAPVTALTAAAAEINEGNLHRQLPRSNNGDELDRLTEVFNAMTARLGSSFQRVREFTLHASHELKTPLTVMHGELETTLAEENLPPAVRERLNSQLAEVQRLSKIVDGLTLLTRADAGQVQLARHALSFDELVREAFADAQILAQPTGLAVKLEACEPVTIEGDRDRLRQLLLNLVDNAVKYNHPQGSLSLKLVRRGADAEFAISNSGPGIPSEMLGRVFERFFRVDGSHNNAVEGCGLGLSIAKWIVTAHHGTVRIESTAGALTTVTVTLLLPEVGKA